MNSTWIDIVDVLAWTGGTLSIVDGMYVVKKEQREIRVPLNDPDPLRQIMIFMLQTWGMV